ncbi:MAG TPA: class I SAM-dependent methyltransferase [Acidimicrobiia bacterium]|nr:class I SAM-dependent methyltransferase [Acidimicrobiia bacterium]
MTTHLDRRGPHPTPRSGVVDTMRSALRGELPERYVRPFDAEFWDVLRAELRPDLTILDIGSGRRPTIPVGDRAGTTRYVGLDISRTELEAAPDGSYDEIVVSDAAVFRPELADRFDLAVSFQVFEHLDAVDVAFETLRRYLKPGGVLVTQFSARYSIFGIVNRMLPHRVSKELLVRLLHRDPATIFPAPYDHCTYPALREILAPWSDWEITPLYLAGQYFNFSRVAKAAYVGLEQQLYERDVRNLATYYIVRAVR